MSSFEQVCKYMNGVTPEMITKKETVLTTISCKEIEKTASTVSTSFFDEVVYHQYLKEATMLFSRKRA